MLIISFCSHAAEAERVENFRLLDQNHSSHELFYHKNAKAVVLLVAMNGCQIVRNLLPDLRDIRAHYGEDVAFMLINPRMQDTYHSIREEVSEFGIDFPVLVDDTQLIGEALDFDRSGEVIVIDTDDWRVVYRGPVNNRLGYETRRNDANENYLADALDAVVSGQPIEVSIRQALGCIINFPEREQKIAHAQISYETLLFPF